MKYVCQCGHEISDTSDFLSNKCEYISDQDKEDLISIIERSPSSAWETFRHYSRTVFQCEKCARLCLPHGNGRLLTFVPEQPNEAAQILRSIEGEKWKRHLRGHWREGKGELWWGFGVKDQGFETNFRNWEELQAKYFEVFERLRGNDILRDAFLKKESELLHEWPITKQ